MISIVKLMALFLFITLVKGTGINLVIFLDDNFVTPKSAVRSKAAKKKIAFSDVSVFYFNRVQGFSSVPR